MSSIELWNHMVSDDLEWEFPLVLFYDIRKYFVCTRIIYCWNSF